ncbi:MULTISPECIES: hypothetical protein [unclassified Neisseria]|uniref:hypothetical protein n=1 Tax=unclassified Neisseria TaxID=2623750 RepID=UPI002666D3B7|nr:MULTISPECIES: hypothetical protein [unclassified Neisseria]MDO1508763.1 hypothetical protein [Neisseria sp. MVDL19-042950]MDO1515022.1 hypothetical protein [Neisseria sp. MVDL18-041461]MDO1562382.1 hypothetical protein [Neisseria sp. MVDL20-010259]
MATLTAVMGQGTAAFLGRLKPLKTTQQNIKKLMLIRLLKNTFNNSPRKKIL